MYKRTVGILLLGSAAGCASAPILIYQIPASSELNKNI
jgi:hypothetical protein